MILEVAAVRVLSPIYGSSLYVLSSVLTVILAALSFGYWYGGKRADKEHSINALYTIITMSGICVLILLTISKWLLPIFGPNFSVTLGPLLFSFGLFFIPAFLLGIVSPYIIKLQSMVTPPEKIGSIVGATFFWGTLGSIIGSLATGFFLIPHLGVTLSIMFVSIILMLLGIFAPVLIGKKLSKRNISVTLLIAIIFSIIVTGSNNKSDDGVIYETEGIYSNIKVRDIYVGDEPIRLLLRDTNNSSAVYKNSINLPFPYLRFSQLYKELVPEPKKALFLGGGAYTAPRTLSVLDPELQIDVVEIEPELFPLAQDYFGLDDISNITNFAMDGRVFLDRYDKGLYDLIFVDVFSTNMAPPFHLTTQEFYKSLSKHLHPEGIIMFNVVSPIKTDSPSVLGSFVKTLQSVFPTITAYGLNNDPSKLQNIMFLARNSTNPININSYQLQAVVGYTNKITLTDLDLERELILTDDKAPVEYLMAK